MDGLAVAVVDYDLVKLLLLSILVWAVDVIDDGLV